MKKIPFLILIIASLSLVLTGCGGSSGGASKSINVTITDFAFSPNSFTVPAGQQISFSAANNGAVQHSFVIMKLGYHVQTHFTEADKPNVFWQKLAIQPGQSVTDSFTAPAEPGEYEIVCEVGGHFEAGMVAKLIVVQQP
ncbi:MAG: cupredoxin domain-containing protein [Chloroflexi bacterium]|nr:cupredoxin domain-containing protein [Chloroflexota bacterium]